MGGEDDGEEEGGAEGGRVARGVGCTFCCARRDSMWPNIIWSSSRREVMR